MNIRKLAAAAAFATGAALALAPFASADTASDAASQIDTLFSGLSPAATNPINLDISYDGYTIYDGGGTADATTITGQYGLAIAYGNGATAYAGGGTGDSAFASGTNALADAGSTTANATGFNFDSASDIGNNTAGGTGPADGAYAGGGSLIGAGDSTGTSSDDTATLLGNTGPTAAGVGGNSGAFAGDGNLIGYSGAGNGDTAYHSGNILGSNDGSAAVDGNGDAAYSTGTDTGNGEGALAGVGNYDNATADTNYTIDGSSVSATNGNLNVALVNGPDNSVGSAGGFSAAEPSSYNVASVFDPFSGATGTADSAVAGNDAATVAGGSNLAEVFLTQGDASALGNMMYDIVSLLGNNAGSF